VSGALGLLARIPLPRLLREPLFLAYARRTGADLREAELPAALYRSFLEFFVRRLTPAARRIDPDPFAVVSPADGRVLDSGTIHQCRFLQAKGQILSLGDLLGSPDLALGFEGGSFVTIYLAPGDYHRFHAPLTGRIVESVRVRGTRLPVSPGWPEGVPRLFLRNARLASFLETEAGLVALVGIGAMSVGSIRVLYEVSSRSSWRRISRTRYVDGRAFRKGEELGRFELGSTIVVLFPATSVRLRPLAPGERVRVGERIGTIAR
jgi:phosphatidylserine decarboxylase